MDNPQILTDPKKKLLVIEDDDLIRNLYVDELRLAGFDVTGCGTGNDAIKEIGEKTFSLILLDIMLPDKNGLEILQTIRGQSVNQKSKVLVLTNLGQESIIKQAFNLGADGYLIKAAYNPDQIINEVKKTLMSS